jgi:hypothetical protein
MRSAPSNWVSAGVLAVVVLRHGDRPWRVTAGQTCVAARALLRTGLPIGAMFLAEAGSFTAVALSIGRFGDVALAGHQIATQVCYLTFMMPSGIGMATTVRVADALAWRDMRRCRRAGMAGLAIGTVSMAVSAVVSAVVLLGARHHIVRLFVDVSAPGAARAVELAENLLLIGAAFSNFRWRAGGSGCSAARHEEDPASARPRGRELLGGGLRRRCPSLRHAPGDLRLLARARRRSCVRGRAPDLGIPSLHDLTDSRPPVTTQNDTHDAVEEASYARTLTQREVSRKRMAVARK